MNVRGVLGNLLGAMQAARAAAITPSAGFGRGPANSTPSGPLERLCNLSGVNRRFHMARYDRIDKDPSVVASPVEASLVARGPVGDGGYILSKRGRRIALSDVMGEDAGRFSRGWYMNLYLSPADRHYWRSPYGGRFVSTHVNPGDAALPVFIGLESLFRKADLFPMAVRANASIASVLETQDFPIGMIAVGSLCVNAIHVLYEEGVEYEKGDLAGFFNIGSSMLLVFPDIGAYPLIEEDDKVSIGQAVAGLE